ncbi:MAG: endonuclease III [Oscillospiraceae bacterium]|nr:endonuclease III [Oscillospiraceae bacterium]
MTKKERGLFCIEALKKEYPDAVCALETENPFELLVAVRLSAQCTDKRVNMVTPVIFERFKTLDDYISADVCEIEEIIHSCGVYRQKAKDIKGMAEKLKHGFGGKIPDTMEELLTLPGVGRKSANLILGDVFGKPAVVADTHFIRIMNRLGFCATKDPHKVELAMKKLLPPEESGDFCHRVVWHGREVCKAQKPRCGGCVLYEVCDSKIHNS